MSIYYSKFDLNTYSGTPYFRAHCPADYPLNLVLQKCRAFRRLPPRLRELSAQAKRWAAKNYPTVVEELRHWYDAEGRELDPQTGRPLTHAQVDAQWAGSEPPDIEVVDIPVPVGGFPDPDTWEPPVAADEEEDAADEDGPTEAQLVSDIAGYGRGRVARDYGVPDEQLAGVGSDRELARLILQKRG